MTATVRKDGEEWKTYEVEEQVIPNVPFDREMISFILTEHYSFNTTWANIAKKLEYYGIHISDSTLGNIAHRCISYLKKAMEAIWKAELYLTNYWMIDETTALVGTLDKNGVKCFATQYLWGIRANKLRLCWFIYDKGSRGRNVIKPYLDKFKGYFTTDGYIVYKLYDKIEDANQIRCACMTHIRRMFVDALLCFMYSLVESCGFNSLSPMKYISHLLQSLRYAKSSDELRNLLPCYCKL